MSKIYLLAYNQYSNRRTKGYSSIASYSPYVLASFDGLNWNPNDGVSTSHVLNTSVEGADYLIVTKTVGVPAQEVIDSRWFVTEAQKTRKGQFVYSLRRDVVYDHLDSVLNATAYIEKGWVNTNDSAIYNREQLDVNQVKSQEILLKDRTETPWIVGYLSSTEDTAEVTWNTDYASTAIDADTWTALNQAFIYDLDNIDLAKFTMPSQGVNYTRSQYIVANFNKNGNLGTTTTSTVPSAIWKTKEVSTGVQSATDMDIMSNNYLGPAVLDPDCSYDVKTFIKNNTTHTGKQYQELRQYSGEVVAYGGKFYKATIRPSSWTNENISITSNSVKNYFVNAINTASSPAYRHDYTASDIAVSVNFKVRSFTVNLSEVNDGVVKVTIPAANARAKLKQQPYNMFAIPFNDFKVKVGGSVVGTQGSASRAIAQGLSAKYSSGALYDLQLLPYFPMQYAIDSYELTTYIDTSKLPASTAQYTPITNANDEVVSYMFWADIDSDSFQIDTEIPVQEDPIDFKIQNQGEMWRLCSPNYSGAFEFYPTRNRGVSHFNVDFTYKPASPYIHVAPEFNVNGLYGQSFGDARGLICGGDFSLPQASDAWLTYQRQNKNYENTFAREMQMLEDTRDEQRRAEKWQIATGTATSMATGAALGSALSASKLSMGIGAAVAGGASLIGGIEDYKANERIFQLQQDYKQDMHTYSLENIQALPMSLTKVGALNQNNKLWPFLEQYLPTVEERAAIENKIIYDGMTIMRIGTIKDFIGTDYVWSKVKANIIEIPLHEDFHMISSIMDELNAGVFLNKEVLK